MAYRDRDEYRRSAVEFDDVRTRTVTRSPAPPRARRGEFEEIDVRFRERDGDLPDFLRGSRRPEAGPVVLRPREDPYEQRQPREPVFREERIVRRAQSVAPVEEEIRFTEKIRSPSVARRRSPSPRAVRYVEPSDTSEHIRIIERERERERVPSPSPSPPPAPPVVRGPVIEREVITHYTDIDHGMIQARQPSPPPAARARSRPRERQTRETDIDIDISRSKGRTGVEVDIHRSASRTRSKSRERRSSRFYDDDIVIRRDLKVDETRSRRRAHSAAARPVEDDESEYITSRVDARGRMGEAWGGATKDWAIVDVPPGTERVRMDGVGGATTDTTWSKYSGVRRTKFVPEREREFRDDLSNRAPSPPPGLGRERVSVSVLDRDREIEIDRVTDRRAPKEMWTEITKDLVIREAIEELGYEYEETDQFFYVMDYLKYDDVLKLTELSEDIRRSSRRQRARDSERSIRIERDYYEDIDRRAYDRRPAPTAPRRDDREHIRETEVIYDRAPSARYR
ncbi:hypothetical protein GGI43DRAFT_383259 [Trichoderma evansii]